MFETVSTAVGAVAAPNVDDIVVLSVLFARRTGTFGTSHIILGQYLGFGFLVAASFAVSIGLLALPDQAVGLLGLIPIGLGVRGLIRARGGAPQSGGAEVEVRQLSTLGVASITVANGADNVAIYAPLFATFGAEDTTTILVVFGLLVAVWCLAGLAIGSHRMVIGVVEWAGEYAIPVVLVALGVYIVGESGLL